MNQKNVASHLNTRNINAQKFDILNKMYTEFPEIVIKNVFLNSHGDRTWRIFYKHINNEESQHEFK